MSKFILQAAFDKKYSDLIIKTCDYCARFSDRDNIAFNKQLVVPLLLDFQGDSLMIKKPKTKLNKLVKKIIVLTIQYVLECPITFGDDEDFQDSSIEQLYGQYITKELPADKELHILLYINPTKSNEIQSVKKLIGCISDNLKVTVDVVLLPVDLDCDADNIKRNLNSLVELKKSASDIFGGVFYMENIDEKGAVHNFSLNDLVEIYGKIALSLINGYDKVSSKDENYPITTFSINSLQIDRFHIVNNWSHNYLKELVSPLIKRDDVNFTIDKNKIKNILNQILTHGKQILSKKTEDGKTTESIADDFKAKTLEAIVNNDLNPKEREYLLDCCLDLSDRTPESVEMMDMESIPLPDDVFADLLNDFNGNGIYRELRDVVLQIQSLKKTISGQEKLIEEKKKFLEDYSYDGELTDDGFIIHGQKFNTYSFDETPLESDYQPKMSTLPTSADLRKYFTKIKNQGGQSACASFSLVSVFEYFMANETKTNPDLSEAFVYYNARNITGETETDCGTTLHNVIRAMTDNGVCVEELCPYNENKHSVKPDETAYSDALNRKLVAAQNVPIDVETIKSAINEGYPVIASFCVFDSFAKNTRGFVSLPSEQERQKSKKEYHAMVICGYSDDQGYFIVRNSWGKSFGDDGYCYIPYAYVRDTDLTIYACAITGIDLSISQHKADSFKYNVFDKDNNIQYAVLQNQLIEEQYKLNSNRELLKTLLSQYINILKSIKSGDCLTDIKTQLDNDINNKESEIKILWDKYAQYKLSNQRNKNIVHIIVSVISVAILGLGLYLSLKLEKSWLTTIIGGFSFIVCLAWFIKRCLSNRNKRADILKQIKALENEIAQLKRSYQKQTEIQKDIAKIISEVEIISDNSIKRKSLLLEIEKILADTYKWLSDNWQDEKEPVLYPELYRTIADGVKNRWNILKDLFVDGFNIEKIKERFESIQEGILRHFNDEFNLKIEDYYGINSDEWRQFEKEANNPVIQAQLTLTGNEPCMSVFFSNIKDPGFINCYPVFVNNNQYLHLFLRRVKVENLRVSIE